MNFLEPALTLSPILMVTAAVLFGQTAERERRAIRRGDADVQPSRLRRALNKPFGRARSHRWLVRVAALVTVVPPMFVLSAASIFLARGADLADHWLNAFVLCFLLQIAIAGVAGYVRVTEGVRLAAE